MIISKTKTSLTLSASSSHFDIASALQQATQYSLSIQKDDHWIGELKSNEFITAWYVMLKQALGLEMSDRDPLISWLLHTQNADGSWSIAPELDGEISITVELYLALKILGVSPQERRMEKAREFILNAGGVAKVRIFTRIQLATFGLLPWSSVPELPPEFILMPSSGPISIYRMSSWARCTVVPLLLISHHRPVYALPNGRSSDNDFLDELWCDPTAKNVPYSSFTWSSLISDPTAFAFNAVDGLLHWFGGLRKFPSRGYARRKCVEWILEHQEPEGDWGGFLLAMQYSILALRLEGFALEDRRVKMGLEALERYAWIDEKGKRIQAAVSPKWDTILSVIGLCDAGHRSNQTRRSLEWLKRSQTLTTRGDWQVYRPGISPGGFGFQYFNTLYPDVDDTAAAILAFVKHDPGIPVSTSILRAIDWILGMTSLDGGWGAFDADNDYQFYNKIPFSDMDALCDPSTADVTGRVIEAFGLLLRSPKLLPAGVADSISHSSDRAIDYLLRTQETNGSWYGRWGSNYIYGTSNVLCGLVYFTNRNDRIQAAIRSATSWLKQVQNPDGGWGETLLTYRDPSLAGKGPSTPSQTAWALMGLLACLPASDPSIKKGVDYFLRTQDERGTWPETAYTGTGFPNHFFIGYSLYSHYFPMMALGRYAKMVGV